ncbi:hypothetical protein OIU77_000546 [Salix suchowensis]|uniref:Uncharacterized protein n=1 Tax=Salix suchowensis TaxID=1278906 RepID=A0ABQ9B9M4_9ROSI|nr:hypothetical protein OIU77_000546 [Salix suchowensis]
MLISHAARAYCYSCICFSYCILIVQVGNFLKLILLHIVSMFSYFFRYLVVLGLLVCHWDLFFLSSGVQRLLLLAHNILRRQLSLVKKQENSKKQLMYSIRRKQPF